MSTFSLQVIDSDEEHEQMEASDIEEKQVDTVEEGKSFKNNF